MIGMRYNVNHVFHLCESMPKYKEACVYVLIKNNIIIYIGSTNEIDTRLKNHWRDKDFDTSVIIRCESIHDALFLETDLIMCIYPEYNYPTQKISEESRIHRRETNKSRWDYFNENKDKPSVESGITLTKHKVIILKSGLTKDSDIISVKNSR